MRYCSSLWRTTCLMAMCLTHTATRAEELVISGSGNPTVVLTALAKAFHKQQAQHHVSIPPSSGAAGGMRDVEAGTVVLGRIGRPLKPEESARGLSYVPLGRDPVVFVAGANTTVNNISSTQALDAFNGNVTNWRELGGKQGPIRAIGREPTDSSRQAIGRAIKPFMTLTFGPGVKLVHLDPQVIDLLDRFPTSLGFLNRSALAECKTKVRLLALDGVDPSPQNVGLERYPIWLEFGLIHKTGQLTPGAKAFIDFTRSSEGIRILRENGVLAAGGPA